MTKATKSITLTKRPRPTGVFVRLSAAELQQVERHARRSHMTAAGYMRWLALSAGDR